MKNRALIPASIKQLEEKYQASIEQDAEQSLKEWLLHHTVAHVLWVSENDKDLLKLPFQPQGLYFKFFEQWENKDKITSNDDLDTWHEGVWNAIRQAHVDEKGVIQKLPEQLKDWKPNETFITTIERGNIAFPSRSVTCPQSRVGLLLELKNWVFYSANKPALDALFGYGNGKFFKVN